MSEGISDWGDMVMPGVYMIQRRNQTAAAAVANANSELGINYEQLYLEAEEIQEHIDRLMRSNEEIMEYLNQLENGAQDDMSNAEDDADVDDMDDVQGMQGIQGMQGVQGTVGEARAEEAGLSDTDLEIFRDALAENEGVIASKKRRLAEILKTLASNKCGCQFHKQGEPAVAPTGPNEPQLTSPPDRFSL